MTVSEKFIDMFTSIPPEHQFLIVFLALGLAIIFIPPWHDDED